MSKSKKWKRWADSCQQYFLQGLWTTDKKNENRWRGFGKSILQRLVLSGKCFVREKLSNQASALTYSTLFSTVPLLAILFAIAKGFGLERFLIDRIRESLVGQEQVANTLIGFVNSYLSHTKSGVFVGLGIILLFVTLLSLTGRIEMTFNQIWQVRRPRSPFRKMTDYTTLFFLLPICAILTGGISIFISSFLNQFCAIDVVGPSLRMFLELVPFILISILFTAFYMFMPNTRVSLRSALIGGVPAGIAFQGLQFFYIHSQVWVSNYNAIYGSFAALPLFMLWCQCSWYIALGGATLSYVDQNIGQFYNGKDSVTFNRRTYNFVTLLVVSLVCKRFAAAQSPYSARQLAGELKMPIRVVNSVLYQMCCTHILVEVIGENPRDLSPTYVPARDIKDITVSEVLSALNTDGESLNVDDLSEYASQRKFYNNLEHSMFEVAPSKTKMQDF